MSRKGLEKVVDCKKLFSTGPQACTFIDNAPFTKDKKSTLISISVLYS